MRFYMRVVRVTLATLPLRDAEVVRCIGTLIRHDPFGLVKYQGLLLFAVAVTRQLTLQFEKGAFLDSQLVKNHLEMAHCKKRSALHPAAQCRIANDRKLVQTLTQKISLTRRSRVKPRRLQSASSKNAIILKHSLRMLIKYRNPNVLASMSRLSFRTTTRSYATWHRRPHRWPLCRCETLRAR